MADYHLHVQMIKRSTGRSAVAAIAYRASEKIYNEHDGRWHDYTRKKDVVYTEIMLPENAPNEYAERSTLWNEVEKSEKRSDSQTAREFDIALPVEFSREEQIALTREYLQKNFVDKGMCADFAIHDKLDGNPHSHVMLTTRHVTKSGFGNKNRDWNKVEQLEEWRENWANICNEKFKAKGLDERIDHRTLQAQGIDREPTIHEGRDPKAKAENLEIKRRNADRTLEKHAEYMHELREMHLILNRETKALRAQTIALRREMQAMRTTAENIDERAEHIRNTKSRLDELKAERENMGFFTNKKDIDSLIQKHERSYEQATSYFAREYNISPEQATAEIKRLEQKATDKQRIVAELQNKLDPIKSQQDEFLLEYQKQKLLADISHDKQKIYNRLSELEKQSQPQKQSAQYIISQTENQRILDSISKENFTRILQDLDPEKQKALLKV